MKIKRSPERLLLFLALLTLGGACRRTVHDSEGLHADESREREDVFTVLPAERLNYHTPPEGTRLEMIDQHHYTIPSPLVFEDGRVVRTPEQWYAERRPELVENWTRILGKLGPTPADERWFGNIDKVEVYGTEKKEHYVRYHLGIPIEKDFFQHHLLLVPSAPGKGPFPAVIAWTSTTPDYTEPERWWGAWLAQRGYVVLTSWSFIRHYRDDLDYTSQVNEAVYERFGHWLPLGKMVHDVQREVAFLKTRSEVDSQRIGFIGFSLSAKTALYVAAFAPEVKATVAIDPHVALHGSTNYGAPWYLDWERSFPDIYTNEYPVPELRGTIWSLLDADPARPGFERNHHELMALCAPRALLLIGCSMDKKRASHSDDLQSWGYFNRAAEVYELLGISDRLSFIPTNDGHRATSPHFDESWKNFFETWLKKTPL